MVTLYSTSIGYGMKPKQQRPNLTKSHKTKPSGSSKKGKWIATVLVILIIAITYAVWPRSQPSSSEPVKNTASETVKKDSAEVVINNSEVANQDDSVNSEQNLNDTNPTQSTTDTNIPSAKEILNAPLPATDSLAKEEVDRLDDENKRLIEQEKLAVDQIAMNKKLTEMKAEQIELLEQQIAQLESTQAAEATAQ